MIAQPLQSTALPTELQRGFFFRRAGNRTRGSTMATLNFTTKPLAEKQRSALSLSGNRTPVTRVTGGYTDHYTNKETQETAFGAVQ